MPGIYIIQNNETEMVYIGQSINPEKRLSQHKTNLRGGYDENDRLQKSFNKHGENVFSFSVVKYCLEEFLDFWERWYIQYYKINGKVYNFESGGNFNKKMSDETKRKLSVYRKGKPGKNHTEEHKAKVSARHKGKFVSKETRDKLSSIFKGRLLTESHRENISKGLFRAYEEGRSRNTKNAMVVMSSKESREKARKSLKETWKIRKEIAKELGVSPKSITKELIKEHKERKQ